MTSKDIPWIVAAGFAGYSTNYNPEWITYVLLFVSLVLLIWSVIHDINRRSFGK